MHEKHVRAIAFVIRCSGAAMTAYELATLLALPGAVWAAISAVIVSQEKLHDTRSSLAERILGTMIGIAVSVAVSAMASRAQAAVAIQMAAAVAICALVTRRFPKLRVAMYTCQIVLLNADPSVPVALIALVILGAIMGYAFHHAAELAVSALADADLTSRDALSRCRVLAGGSEDNRE